MTKTPDATIHPETVFLYGELHGTTEGEDASNPTHPYHDARCECPRHCLNCRADLQGHDSATGVMGPRTRYCSSYCKGRMARERALDRAMGLR